MNHRQSRAARAGVGLVSVATAVMVLASSAGAQAIPFAHPAFKRVWDRTDALVASGQVSRTFFWGPEPRAAAQEQYVDSPTGTGTRLVQYFDKSRMEVNNPNGDQNSPFFVTNGLLTIELISGQMQIGNNAFINRFSANIPISGDTDDAQAPTYVSFGSVSNTRLGDHPQPDRSRGTVVQFATATINKAGQVGNDPTKATVAGAKIVYFEPATKHNIPDVFWQFLNATGPISETGQIVNKRLIDPWFYASGFPISDPYWSRVKIKGEMQDVMIQAYERRVLTYVPNNPPGFLVEMGNIGLHYYDWRYKDAGKPTGTPATSTAVGTGVVSTATPTVTGTPPTATPTRTGTPPTATSTVTSTPNVITQGIIAFGSDKAGNRDIWRVNADGTERKNLTLTSPQKDDYPVYSPDRTKIAFASNRDGNFEIYVMNADGSAPLRLTNNVGMDIAPAWSPDGAKIAFVSERNESQADVYVMNANGTGTIRITDSITEDTDPAWGSNGRIVFTSKRSGSRQLYTMNPDGSQVTGPITTGTTGGENFLARWNNVGNRLVFVSIRDGNQEIYISGAGGQEPTRLTNNEFEDWDPTFAPDGSRIAFSSERFPDNLEWDVMNNDGSSQERITLELTDDVHPSWSIRSTP